MPAYQSLINKSCPVTVEKITAKTTEPDSNSDAKSCFSARNVKLQLQLSKETEAKTNTSDPNNEIYPKQENVSTTRTRYQYT